MAIAIYFTKIEIINPKTTAVSVVIDSEFGRFHLDIPVEAASGDPNAIIDHVRRRITHFGNELMNHAGTLQSLRLTIPPVRS